MAYPITRIIPFLIITVACVVAVEVGFKGLELYMERAMTATVAPDVEQHEAVAVEQDSGVAGRPADHSIIVQRNLFGSALGDKPAEEVAAVAEEQVLEKTDKELVLMGTVNTAGDDNGSRAIVLNLKGGKQSIFQVGDAVEGAVIQTIKRGQVILEVDGKQEVMDMTDAAKYRSPAPVQSAADPGPGRTGAVNDRRQAVAAMTGRPETSQARRRDVRPRTVRPARRVIPRRTSPDQ